MMNCCPEAIATDTESVATVTKYLISVSNGSCSFILISWIRREQTNRTLPLKRIYIVIYSNMVKSWSEPILIENSVALQGPTKNMKSGFYTFFFLLLSYFNPSPSIIFFSIANTLYEVTNFKLSRFLLLQVLVDETWKRL